MILMIFGILEIVSVLTIVLVSIVRVREGNASHGCSISADAMRVLYHTRDRGTAIESYIEYMDSERTRHSKNARIADKICPFAIGCSVFGAVGLILMLI